MVLPLIRPLPWYLLPAHCRARLKVGQPGCGPLVLAQSPSGNPSFQPTRRSGRLPMACLALFGFTSNRLVFRASSSARRYGAGSRRRCSLHEPTDLGLHR